jgi:hypothetical protein
MDKLRIPGLTGIDLSTSDADTPPNKLLHSENFILSQKYGNLRKRAGSVEYSITGSIYGIAGYAKSNVSFLSPISVIPVRYRVASSTPYFEQLDWDQEGDLRNYYTYSEALDNAAWNKQSVTITADSVVAPDAATTADTMTASAATSVHYFYPTASPSGLASGGKERHSVYIKKGTHPYVSVSNAYGDALIYDFDAATSKTSYAAGGFTYSAVEGVENGWYRFTIEFTKTSSTTRQIYVAMRGNYSSSATGVGSSWTAAGTETIYVWGMQCNDVSDLETYVATTTAAVSTPAWAPITINADVSSLLQSSGVVRMPQIEDTMAVFAGTPAKITDITSGELKRLGSEAPTVAPTIAASAGAGALTGDFYCAYTYYDPTSGWESSLSPFSTLLTIAAKDIEWSALPTTATKSGVTQLRLYRTESSGEQVFYRVTTHNLGSSTYTDAVTLLGSISTDVGENDPPPSGAYLGEEYASRFWTTSGETALRFSKAFDGDANNLQYWPDTNVIYFDHKITGLRKSERLGGLLVFKPPGYGIDLIRGSSEDTFEVVSLYSELGTNYDSSITVVGDDLVFWGDGRPILIRNGNMIPYYSKPLEDKLNQLALNDYNTGSFVWSFYHNQYQQIFWGVSALSDSGSSWEELGSGLFAGWEVKGTGAPAGWS